MLGLLRLPRGRSWHHRVRMGGKSRLLCALCIVLLVSKPDEITSAQQAIGSAPVLTIERAPSDAVRLAWPAERSDFILQWAQNVTGIWSRATSPSTAEGSRLAVYEPIGGGAKFYRLKAGDWPQFRGPGGLGLGSATGLPVTWSTQQNVVWQSELPGPGSSSPIVVGERVFVTCYSGYGVPGGTAGDVSQLKRHLLCLNQADGATLWNKVIPAKLPEDPYEGFMREHGYASSTPAADGDRVYAFFGKSGVFAFDHDGRQLWQADVGSGRSEWNGASLVIYKDLLIVNAGVESGSLVALDRRTGREIWRTGGIRYSYNTPVLVALPADKTELVVQIGGGGEPGGGKLLGFDPDRGELLWNCAGDPGYICASVVAHHGVVYAVPRGTVMAVRAGGRGDVTASHRLWRVGQGSNVPSPVYHQGHLYFANEEGLVYCLDAHSGERRYQERLSPAAGQIYASPVLAEGRLHYVSRRGHTYVVAAKPTFEQLAHNDLSDGSIFNASPAISNGQLLLRSDRFLYCIGRK